MSTFALIHGAWHRAWAWERLVPELQARGHTAVAPDLRCDDVARGTAEYAATVVEALDGAGDDVVVVGHSLAGITVPLVAAARPVHQLVYLCALLPTPGLPLAARFARENPFVPGADQGRAVDDQGRSLWMDPAAATRTLYGQCEPELAAVAVTRLCPQASTPSTEPCPLRVLPDVPAAYVLATDDRIVSPAWSRAVAREELGVEPIELDGCDHSPMLSRPGRLADVLTEIGGKPTRRGPQGGR